MASASGRPARSQGTTADTAEMRQISASQQDPETLAGLCSPKIFSLSTELRCLIYLHLVRYHRPFMIGRCQEATPADCRAPSPRDIQTVEQGGARPRERFKIIRDEGQHRPIQPAITRVCYEIRHEALPIFYEENEFWLIHNQFNPILTLPSFRTPRPVFKARRYGPDGVLPPRGFDAWLQQTPRPMFDHMQQIALCGYGQDWPSRYRIEVDIKKRRVIGVKHYSTYGDELPLHRPECFFEELQEVLGNPAHGDGFATLQALLRECDWLFQIPSGYAGRPELEHWRKPAEGWEYDW